ncbi:ABC transporter permease [Pseudaeromonas sp. ZJS20]|uniref:ABC transporter permease n=1 Tax=Pseudaeromonas aegiceratis TaxID=3153928 RepID=UPI00390C6DB1
MDAARHQRLNRWFIYGWTLFILLFTYLPVLCDALSSLAKSRYFMFPVRAWSTLWWEKTADSMEIGVITNNSLKIALLVTLLSTLIAFFGALAFARYDWTGRKGFQKLVLLPIFFPQPVLGLALLLWFNALGIQLSWLTAVFAHLVWITPVVTLVIAIQVYGFDPTLELAARDLGANRWQICTQITLPLLWPGIWSGMLFAFLLSWGNFPLSLYTSGVDNTIPKWLYSKMGAGYSPMVPTLGTMSTLGAAAVMALGAGLIWLVNRRRRQQ